MSTLASPAAEPDTNERPYAPLLERLRGTAKVLPPSHTPSIAELAGIVGALVAYVEHGDDAVDLDEAHDSQAGHDEIAAVLTSKQPDPQYVNTGNAQQDGMAARVAELERLLASQQTSPTATTSAADAYELDADLEAQNRALREQLAIATGAANAAGTTVTSQPAPGDTGTPA